MRERVPFVGKPRIGIVEVPVDVPAARLESMLLHELRRLHAVGLREIGRSAIAAMQCRPLLREVAHELGGFWFDALGLFLAFQCQ